MVLNEMEVDLYTLLSKIPFVYPYKSIVSWFWVAVFSVNLLSVRLIYPRANTAPPSWARLLVKFEPITLDFSVELYIAPPWYFALLFASVELVIVNLP